MDEQKEGIVFFLMNSDSSLAVPWPAPSEPSPPNNSGNKDATFISSTHLQYHHHTAYFHLHSLHLHFTFPMLLSLQSTLISYVTY